MTTTRVLVSRHDYERVRRELLESTDGDERAGFLYVTQGPESSDFRLVKAYYPKSGDLAEASGGYLELRDGVLNLIVREAHTLGAAIVEMHSHPFDRSKRTQFSWLDKRELSAVVPHVLWRLPGRPYFAFVFGHSAFDSLCWIERRAVPSCSVELVVDAVVHSPTGLTLQDWRRHVESI